MHKQGSLYKLGQLERRLLANAGDMAEHSAWLLRTEQTGRAAARNGAQSGRLTNESASRKTDVSPNMNCTGGDSWDLASNLSAIGRSILT